MLRRSARVVVVLAAILAAAAGAGCGGSDKAGSNTRPLVTFGRTGGDDAKTYGLVVEEGRGATVTQYPAKQKRFTVDSGKHSDLRDALVDLNISGLKSSYEPNPPTAEGYRYSVTYRGTTVQAAEKAKLPDALKSVIDKLDDLLDDHI